MKEATRVLLTGATGSIGGETLRQLVDDPSFAVSVLVRKDDASRALLSRYSERIVIHYGDLTDPSSLESACKQQDAVLHVAAIIPPLADEKPELAEAVNVGGTANLLAALKHHSPDCFFIFTSSISVYGDRIDDPWIRVGDPLRQSIGDAYAGTKMRAEEKVAASGLDAVILRLTAIMGYGNHKPGGLMFHMPLNTPVEICTPQDTARALVKAISQRERLKGRIFNLGGGKECRILYRDLLARSFQAFGLGRLDFPDKAFAEQNFHCGYYADGDALEDILAFRADTIESYFAKLHNSVSPLRRFATRLLAWGLKQMLLAKSEPYHAFKTRDQALMRRFFKAADQRSPTNGARPALAKGA